MSEKGMSLGAEIRSMERKARKDERVRVKRLLLEEIYEVNSMKTGLSLENKQHFKEIVERVLG